MIDEARLQRTRVELSTKTKQQIEAETAETWAARAIVAYERFAAPNVLGTPQRLKLYAEAVDYERESHEHASEGGNLAYVSSVIDAAKGRFGLL